MTCDSRRRIKKLYRALAQGIVSEDEVCLSHISYALSNLTLLSGSYFITCFSPFVDKSHSLVIYS